MSIRSYQNIVQALVTPSSGPPPEGLGDELLWLCPTLDDSPNDISDSGYTGTYNNGMGTVADTDEGGVRAYEFDGVNQHISNLGQSEWDFVNTTGIFTISNWQKYDATTPSTQFAIGTRQGTDTIGFAQWFSGGGGTRFDVTKNDISAYSATVQDGVTSGANVWRHVVAVGDGTDLKLYVDGVLKATSSFTGFITGGSQSEPLSIGSDGQPLYYMDGRLDDIRIFDRALSLSEVRHLSSARGVQGPPPEGLGDELLWLCPSLDDSANDISGSGYTGTYNGGMGTTANTDEGGVRAYQFNGSSQYITTIGQSEWDFINNDGIFSISLWAKNDVSSPASQQTLISTNYDSVAVGWGLYYNGSTGIRFDLARGASGSFSASVSNSVTSGNDVWQHVTVTGDGTKVRMFIDGVLTDTATIIALTGGTQSNVLSVGSYVGALLMWDGLIDDIRIFDRPLTQNEINWVSYSRGIEDAALVPDVGIKALTLSGSKLQIDNTAYLAQPEFSGYAVSAINFQHAEDASGTDATDDTQTASGIWTEGKNAYYKCLMTVTKAGVPDAIGESDWTHVRDLVPDAWTGLGGETAWICFSNVSDITVEQVSEELLTSGGSPALIADTTHGGEFALEAESGRVSASNLLSDVPQQDRFHISFWYKWYGNKTQPSFVSVEEDLTGAANGQSRIVYDIPSSSSNAGWYCGKQVGGNAYIQAVTGCTMTPQDEWNHVVAEFNSGTSSQAQRWWINGVFQGASGSTSGYLGYLLQRAGQPWLVNVGGALRSTDYVNADIDDVRVWMNYPLTVPHYASLYRGRGYNGRPGKVQANFRTTNSYVDNPLGSYFTSGTDVYSQRNGHGWSTTVGSANRTTTVDDRLAGIVFTAGNTVYYRYDLPNGPGKYTISAASYDPNALTPAGYSFKDGVGGASLHDWTGSRSSVANVIDLNEDEYTPADFFASETGIDMTFTSDHLAVTRNTSLIAGNGAITWLSVEPFVEPPSFNPAWAQLANNSIIGYF